MRNRPNMTPTGRGADKPVRAGVAAPRRTIRNIKAPWLLVCAMWLLMMPGMLPDGLDFSRPPLDPNAVNANVGVMLTMPTQGSVSSRIMWLSLLAFGLIVIISRSRQALRLLKATNPFFLAFVSLCLVSVLWSIEPGVTLRRCLRLVTVTADATAFVLLARSVTNFQSVLRPMLTTFLIGSVIFVIAAPKLGIEQLNQAELVGAWRGLASQKNVLGAVAAVGVLLWLHAALSKESALWKSLPGLAISALCLIKSRSSTSLMATVFASGLMLMLIRSPSSLRRYVPYITTAYACLLLLYSLAVLDLIPGSGTLLAPITTLVGKDLTFSGRTAIWDVIRENIALHPFLGGGYGAYWTGLPNSPSMEMLRRLYFYPTESHNGYIDVYNDLGLVGEICLVGFVIAYVRQGITIYKTSRSQGALYLSLLFQQMIGNLSEARWFNALNGDLIIVTIATMALARSLCDQSVPTSKRQTSSPTPSARPGDELATKRRPAFHLRNRRAGHIAK